MKTEDDESVIHNGKKWIYEKIAISVEFRELKLLKFSLKKLRW